MGIKTGTLATKQSAIEESSEKINLAKLDKEYSLAPIQENFKNEILASGEIDKITSLIDLSNTNTIVEFGKAPAQEIGKVADQVLEHYNMSYLTQTSGLVDNLLSVMKKIDINEIKEVTEKSMNSKKGFIDKWLNKAEKKLKQIVGKYQSITSELENICNELTTYENQIKTSNKDIEKMYEQSLETFKELTKYILAGEQAIKEIEDYKKSLEEQLASSGNTDLQFEIQNVEQAIALMQKRVLDLRGAESVALQSVPAFKFQEYTNAHLARKINSAFIVTIPAFKSALVNSVIARQQAMQMQGLQALDDATSQLVRQNAENAVSQLQQAQKLSNTSAVKADDIEYAWNTLMTGIQQYKESEKQYLELNKEEARRIEESNSKYLQALATGNGI